jgi:hypothetical protein
MSGLANSLKINVPFIPMLTLPQRSCHVALVVITDKLLLSIMGEDNFTRMDAEHSLNHCLEALQRVLAWEMPCLRESTSTKNIQLSPPRHPLFRSTPLVVRHNDFNLFSVGFEVFTAVVIRTTIFWDIMACSRSQNMKLFLICSACS